MNVENSLSTRKNIECARKSFESLTGKKVKGATVSDIEQWLNAMREKGRSANTCRTYLSFVRQLAGIKAGFELPGREKVESRTLSNDELKFMLCMVKPESYALLAALVLCGSAVLAWKWEMLVKTDKEISIDAKIILIHEANRRGHDARGLLSLGQASAHWVNGVNLNEVIFPQSQHGINRRLKRIARKAGIGDKGVNVTALKNTNKLLVRKYGNADKASKALGIKVPPLPVEYFLVTAASAQAERKIKSEPRLHGIGRRTALMKPA